MSIRKGSLIKQTRRNEDEIFKNTTANSELVYEVTRVNKNTFTVKCVEGYMKGTGGKILKEALTKIYRDVYGTETIYEVLAI